MFPKNKSKQQRKQFLNEHTICGCNTEANLVNGNLAPKNKNEIFGCNFKKKSKKFDWWSYEYGFGSYE